MVYLLQVLDREKVTLPANWYADKLEWKSFSLIGDKVIIPPVNSIGKAKEIEGKDKKKEIGMLD